MKLFFLILIYSLWCSCTKDKVTGTSDDTSTGIKASVLYENGTPSADVTVLLFKAGDTSMVAIETVTTDSSGIFHIDDISSGTYTLFSETDSLAAFIDSVKVNTRKENLEDIVLRQKSRLSGVVTVAPGQSPQTITVQALGTHLFATVDTNGSFTLTGLAEGDYTLYIKTTNTMFTPLYRSVGIDAGTDKILSDTMQLSTHKTAITTDNLSGMWYMYQSSGVATKITDGNATETTNDLLQYHTDSATVYVFNQSTHSIYSPNYGNDCCSEREGSYTIQNGKLISDLLVDNHNVSDTVNNYYENSSLQEVYLTGNELRLIMRLEVRSEAGEGVILYTAKFARYTKSIPNQVWPENKCNLSDWVF